MPGFFKDTSGLDNTDSGLSTNNAAGDFERSGATPSNLFERLFGGRLPPAAAAPAPPPALSSAPSLVGRILQSSAPPPPPPAPAPNIPPQEPPYNPTGMQAPPSMLRAPQRPPAPPFMRAPPMEQPPPFAFQGIPQFGSPGPGPQQPMPRGLPMPYPTQGAGAPPFPPMQQPGGAGPLSPGDAQALVHFMRQMQAGGGQAPNYRHGGAVGYFRGGDVQRFSRGGFPQLMGGLPERRPFAGAGYVAPDGRGDGRSDHIKAVLSPGEFVADAETVSLLGNGDNDAGARGMEAIRQEIRKHKGKALAKGKFSPNAQSPAKLAKIGARAASKKGRS